MDQFIKMAVYFRENPTDDLGMIQVEVMRLLNYSLSSAKTTATRLYWVDRNPISKQALDRYLTGDTSISPTVIKASAVNPNKSRKQKRYPWKEELTYLKIERDIFQAPEYPLISVNDFHRQDPEFKLEDVVKAYSRLIHKKM